MNPGTFDELVAINRGTKFEHTLTFFQGQTDDPVDLTGLAPFVCTLANPRTKELLAELTVTDTDIANGQITITASEEQTAALPLGPVVLGLRDALGNPYLKDTIQVEFFPL